MIKGPPYVILILVGAFFLMSFANKKKKLTFWMIGDSTMSVKADKARPETGWGMAFAAFWDSTVNIENHAQNGRSTRTFLEEKRWDPILEKIQEGDYVFIQFGHNDEVPEKKSYVNPVDYKKYLQKYLDDTRSKKGIPILLTPVERRKFDSLGNALETHKVYAQIVRDLAAEEKVLLIDLAKSSKAMLQELGKERSALLFNQLSPGQHPNYPSGKMDNTHFNELGARMVAELVLRELKVLVPEMATRLKFKV